MKTTKAQAELFTAMKAGKLENQNQQNLIFKIINGNNIYLKEQVKAFFNDSNFDGIELSDEQNEKGYKWLLSHWKTPSGIARTNNPYGYREQHALEQFDRITLKGYYDIGNYGHCHYVPLYDVYAKDCYGFEYSVKNGTPYIVG